MYTLCSLTCEKNIVSLRESWEAFNYFETPLVCHETAVASCERPENEKTKSNS